MSNLARLEHNGGRYRLTYPRTVPILSWRDDDLDFAIGRPHWAMIHCSVQDRTQRSRIPGRPLCSAVRFPQTLLAQR
jgi:hypothetical protein